MADAAEAEAAGAEVVEVEMKEQPPKRTRKVQFGARVCDMED